MPTAVIYYSLLGGTKMAAEYIGSRIGADVVSIKEATDVSKYDKIIIGSGVYAGKIPKLVTKLIKESNHPNVHLFLSCLYKGERGDAQLKKISGALNVKDAIFFNKVKKQIGVEGSKLDDYIAKLTHAN